MHVNVKIYIRFQILLVWTFTEYYINIFGGPKGIPAPPEIILGGPRPPRPPPPLPTPLHRIAEKFAACNERRRAFFGSFD